MLVSEYQDMVLCIADLKIGSLSYIATPDIIIVGEVTDIVFANGLTEEEYDDECEQMLSESGNGDYTGEFVTDDIIAYVKITQFHFGIE